MTTRSDPNEISKDEVNKAQKRWCKGLLKICREYINGGNYRAEAEAFIDKNYDFAKSEVFFRPTLAMAPHNFRTTREGALSYFIGENPRFNDEGFIKKKWVEAKFDNRIEGKDAIQVHGNIGIAMGNVYLRQEVTIGGNWTVVDKVFVFLKRDGEVRLIVHNSALSNIPATEVPEDAEDAE
jgi:hypothetical protein